MEAKWGLNEELSGSVLSNMWSTLSEMDKYILARWSYSVNMPIIQDATYNILDSYIKEAFPDDEYVNRTWSDDPCPTDLLKLVGREDLIMAVTLADRTESIPSLNSESEIHDTLSTINGDGTLSMKHDGWNVQANYYNGDLVFFHTRGRSSDSMDLARLISRIPHTIPFSGKTKVVLELTVGKTAFKQCKQLFGNVHPRSAVPSVVARPQYYDLLSMHAFDIHGVDLLGQCKFDVLKSIGFDVPMFYRVTDYSSLREAMQLLSDSAETYEFPTDGMVYDGDMRRAIRLLHWEEPIYQSYVIGYEEQFGPHRISPSVCVRPVNRFGVTQRKLSLTNWQRIIDYNLQKGAPIAFRIASSAIADFDEEATLILHKKWEGKWDEYSAIVDREEMSRESLEHLSNLNMFV